MWSAATACLSGCLTTHPLALMDTVLVGQNSRHLDVGNFINQDITILRVGGDQLANTAR